MTYSFTEINGTGFHYQVSGSGQPLVLIHAGIAHLEMWDDQVGEFAQHYRVIRYDVRGEGRTPSPPGVYSDHADLRGLLDYLEVEQAAILGASNGGRIAIDFAVAYPERVKALILVAPGLGGYEYPPAGAAVEQREKAIEAAYEKGDTALVAELETRFWVDGLNRRPDQLDPAMRARARAMNKFTLDLPEAQGDRQRLDPPAIFRLAGINVPTLVMAGDQDIPDMLAIAHFLAEKIKGAQKVVIPDTAHLPNMEKPAGFNRLALDFLAHV